MRAWYQSKLIDAWPHREMSLCASAPSGPLNHADDQRAKSSIDAHKTPMHVILMSHQRLAVVETKRESGKERRPANAVAKVSNAATEPSLIGEASAKWSDAQMMKHSVIDQSIGMKKVKREKMVAMRAEVNSAEIDPHLVASSLVSYLSTVGCACG